MQMKTIAILNGPNLNLLGVREPHIYGNTTLAEVEDLCHQTAKKHQLIIDFQQSNQEGILVNHIHKAYHKGAAGIIINPAAYSFTSIALLDALKIFNGIVIEYHISNIHKREEIYHHSLISKRADAVMAGLGASGYQLAIEAMAMMIAK